MVGKQCSQLAVICGIVLFLGGSFACQKSATPPPKTTQTKAKQKPSAESPSPREPRSDSQSLPSLPELPKPLGMLVTVEELRDRSPDANLRILDVRSPNDYAAGHIPNAVSMDLAAWKELALSPGGLNNADAWAERVGALGIGQDSDVVIYAARPTNVALLDGGWPAWSSSGLPTSTHAPEVKSADFQPMFQKDRLAEIAELKGLHNSETVTVIDTRSDEEFSGGRIPGAVHLEWKYLVDSDGHFKPAAELKSLFADRGIAEATTAITYCRSGGRASLEAFALELLLQLAGVGQQRRRANREMIARSASTLRKTRIVERDPERAARYSAATHHADQWDR
jgi:thiosulfate/3-mercaptopyruvate sulfurtransferase